VEHIADRVAIIRIGKLIILESLARLREGATHTIEVRLFATAGCVALAVGAATGQPGLIRAVASVVALASYLANTLAQITATVRPARAVSSFHLLFGNDPLGHGVQVGNA
jgi:hypothetical protein